MRIELRRDDEVHSGGDFLQGRFWAEFKAQAGWRYARYEATVGDGASFPLSVLERGLGAGLGFAYVPHGPDYLGSASPEARTELLSGLAEALRPFLSRSCLFVRFDPAWYEVGTAAEDPSGEACAGESPAGEAKAVAPTRPGRPSLRAPLRKGSDVQPPDSVILRIDRPDEELLAGMKPKWRYNVRLAEKKGVAVDSEGPRALNDFYRLYEATASRDRIAIHPRSYYERLFSLGATSVGTPRPELRLWVARFEGEALAAIVTLYYGETATYLYGASSDEKRNLMPAYALQWAAIRAARETGCLWYDFYGIPPSDAPDHPMAGLYRFKTGFGGEIRHYAGAWDYILRPAPYAAFRAAERARLFWHKGVRKRLGGQSMRRDQADRVALPKPS